MTTIEKVLVLGASGDQGIPLVKALLEAGVETIGGARRTDAMANTPFPYIQTIHADIMNQASLEEAFSQVDALTMHLPFEFDLDVAETFGRNIGAAAAAAGLKKIVFNTSCYVAEQDLGLSAHDGRRRIEASIRESGVDYVILRPAVFMDNMIRIWIKPSIVKNNIFAYPASETLKISWICLEDLAKLSAYAVVTTSLRNESILVGGPQALTGYEVAEQLSVAAQRTINFKSMPPQVFAENMSELVTGSREVEPLSIYDGMASFYSWYNQQTESPVDIDPTGFAERLPVKLSTFAEWAARQDWDSV